jgi:hypothetical protein
LPCIISTGGSCYHRNNQYYMKSSCGTIII